MFRWLPVPTECRCWNNGVCVNFTGSRSTMKKKQFEISTNDRVSIFIELADAYRQLGRQVHTHSQLLVTGTSRSLLAGSLQCHLSCLCGYNILTGYSWYDSVFVQPCDLQVSFLSIYITTLHYTICSQTNGHYRRTTKRCHHLPLEVKNCACLFELL